MYVCIQMSDDEPVDFQADLVKQVHPQCIKQWTAYEACSKRIDGKDDGNNCNGTFTEYWKCIDSKIAKKVCLYIAMYYYTIHNITLTIYMYIFYC